MGHILVIAPNADLRQSLRFALEADGHSIAAYPGLGDVAEPPGRFDCTVLDHHAVDANAAASGFLSAFSPVVLLANTASHPLAARAALTLTKPTLGPFLSQAVTEAMLTRKATT